MKELLAAVREARRLDVPALLSGLDRAGRRSALAELKELRKEARSWPWEKQDRIRKALLVAGAGCHTGAAGCAAWIGSRDLQIWSRPPYPMLLSVLADRDPEWLGDVAHRLAARPGTAETAYELITGLVKTSRCPVPTTDGFVRGWAEAVSASQWQQKRRPLADVLRADPYVTVLVPRLFEVAELPSQMLWFDEPDDQSRWHVALAVLADEGLLERASLVDGCVARLIRGGRPGELRFFLTVLRQLALTREEEAERVADWAAMAADGISTVAGHAQEVLARLDGHGELPVRSLAEVSGSLLFRPEKKLVRAQLVLIGKTLRRDPSAADELLPVVAETFGHADIDIQERALKIVARHLPAVDAAVREETALSAPLLGPALRTAAAEAFGDLMDDITAAEPYVELLPSAPVLRRVEPAPATLPELVEEVVVLARSASRDVTAFERALDGLVRHAHTDRPALTEALRDALAGSWWLVDESQKRVEQRLRSEAGITLVVAVLLGLVPIQAVHVGRAAWSVSSVCVHAALKGVLKARLWEAADAMLTGSTPFLLAFPTWHTGSLDPAVLIERLRTYQQLGVRPGEADFAQALLRVRRDGQHEAAEAADRLGTPEGDRLAAWLRADRPLATVYRFDLERQESTARGWVERQPADWTRNILMASDEHPFIQREFPRSFHWLGCAHTPRHRTCDHGNDHPDSWLATLPEDSETLAAWLLPAMATCATDELKDAARPLLGLVELGGSAAEAIHLAVGYGLGARYPEDRLSAVDALLILAAQQRLDTTSLGEQLAILLDHRLVKPTRLADSARTAAATGAYRTVLSVLVPVLPGLLANKKGTRGLSDLLSVAADCAEHCGAVGGGEAIPGLAETAARGGSSQLVRQAVRLQAAWERGLGQT
ncbi:DUF6493 family protein [Streptomyces sp. NBC_01363]|uniref:DUF7824 domain-containing protein n=1 Tax=Streptomyces sp. NBC_01363 TaxID=2903840 RepID=UPI002251A25B|nr:DUF6493 family protein [Streptomyces sp. NBC_01363]MCX4733561.1 DUF6493 family protein [Streptomyces sp. NBC_01363]